MEQATFTLGSVNFKKDLPAAGNRPPLQVWEIGLGDGRTAELLTKPGNGPSVGESLELQITESEYGLKAKKPPMQGQGGGGGGGSWKPEHEYDPVRVATIRRQHSQEMAIRFLVATGKLDASMADTPSKEVLERVETVANWFDADISEAGDRATAPSGNGQPQVPPGSPVEPTPAQPAGGPPPDDDIPF